MAATTDQKARLLDLTTGILEMVRDGNRPIEEVSRIFQLIKDRPDFAKVLSVNLVKLPIYPVDGEIFELILDGDASENDPIEMVRHNGYSQPERWKYTGKRVTGRQTGSFKLVSVGYGRNLDEVRQKLAQHGEVPEGQWREAFKASYPKPEGDGPVGIADPSWVNPRRYAHFPFVNTDGTSNFIWAAHDFCDFWRWLVRVSK